MPRRLKPDAATRAGLKVLARMRQRADARFGGQDPAGRPPEQHARQLARMQAHLDRHLQAQLERLRARDPSLAGKRLGYDPATEEVTVDD